MKSAAVKGGLPPPALRPSILLIAKISFATANTGAAVTFQPNGSLNFCWARRKLPLSLNDRDGRSGKIDPVLPVSAPLHALQAMVGYGLCSACRTGADGARLNHPTGLEPSGPR